MAKRLDDAALEETLGQACRMKEEAARAFTQGATPAALRSFHMVLPHVILCNILPPVLTSPRLTPLQPRHCFTSRALQHTRARVLWPACRPLPRLQPETTLLREHLSSRFSSSTTLPVCLHHTSH
jgi:hypothetical protein